MDDGSEIVTGGSKRGSGKTIFYSADGKKEDLAEMNVKRRNHGCSMFLNCHNEKVWGKARKRTFCLYSLKYFQIFLVTGGKDERGKRLDSTEIMIGEHGKWKIVEGKLPSPLSSPAVVTLNNQVYLTGDFFSRWSNLFAINHCFEGGTDGHENLKVTLEYEPSSGTWRQTSWGLLTPRHAHAVSVVHDHQLLPFCK